MSPQLPLRFARAQSIEDPQAQTEHSCKFHRAIECLQAITVEKACRRSIDWFAGEIALSRINQIDLDIVACAGNFNKIHSCGSEPISELQLGPV